MFQIDIQKSVVAISFEGKIAATFIFYVFLAWKEKSMLAYILSLSNVHVGT